jgi:cytochrome c
MRTGRAVVGALPAAALACAWIAAAASVAQDARSQSAAFSACAACHSVDGSNGTGPSLKGVVGRTSGTVPGFRYSRAMKSAGIAWDEASLDRYLANPQEVVPGNIMPFSGVADAPVRAEIIAYLKTLR